MKKLMVIQFTDASEYRQYANAVCDKFSGLPEKSEFIGTWWIDFNEEEAYAAISQVVNHFIKNTDKTNIIFGIGKKDYEGVISKIYVVDCVVEPVNCKNL